jgi:hypothetical protein
VDTEQEKHKAQILNALTLCFREGRGSFGFSNPGDLRVVSKTCGGGACHEVESKNVSRSMMTHGAMLWGAALYNNGSFH